MQGTDPSQSIPASLGLAGYHSIVFQPRSSGFDTVSPMPQFSDLATLGLDLSVCLCDKLICLYLPLDFRSFFDSDFHSSLCLGRHYNIPPPILQRFEYDSGSLPPRSFSRDDRSYGVIGRSVACPVRPALEEINLNHHPDWLSSHWRFGSTPTSRTSRKSIFAKQPIFFSLGWPTPLFFLSVGDLNNLLLSGDLRLSPPSSPLLLCLP